MSRLLIRLLDALSADPLSLSDTKCIARGSITLGPNRVLSSALVKANFIHAESGYPRNCQDWSKYFYVRLAQWSRYSYSSKGAKVTVTCELGILQSSNNLAAIWQFPCAL